MKRNRHEAALLTQREQVFHTQDLAVLWGIANLNTLHTTIKRYCDRGILHRIYKGMYSTVPPDEIDPWILGAKAIHGFCYLSMESVLQMHGMLNSLFSTITFIGSKSKTFQIGANSYRSRKVKDTYLFNAAGIMERQTLRIASLERAIADMLYFNPSFHFDRPIDWKTVQQTQKEIGYPLTPHRYVDSSS